MLLFARAVMGVLLATCMGVAQAEKTFAHSKSLDMSFIAQGTPWCQGTVDMRVEAGDPGKFGTSGFRDIIGKLGTVLVRDCPRAAEVVITGVHDGAVVWSGTASRTEDWRPVARAGGEVRERVADGTSPSDAGPDGDRTEDRRRSDSGPRTVTQNTREIAGWSPSGLLTVAEDAGEMRELANEAGNCRVTLFLEDIRWDLEPHFKLRNEEHFDCTGGYLNSKGTSSRSIRLYYRGQKKYFDRFYGIWQGGFNLDRGKPEKLVRRYAVEEDGDREERVLAWLGSDQDLRAHYFVSYEWDSNQWDLVRNAPVLVLTDNERVQRQPGETNLARSLAGTVQEFFNVRRTNRFSNVSFAVIGKLPDHPLKALEEAEEAENPPAYFYAAGQARKEQGMPWEARVETDFVANRRAYAEAEQRRREQERQRRAELRRMHRDALASQFERLKELDAHGRARFYATMQFEPDRLENGKIDLDSRYQREGSLLRDQVSFAHPARFIGRGEDGLVELGSHFYMVVEADGPEISSPYRMTVEDNRSRLELDGWHVVKVAPRFSFEYEGNTPVFRITVTEAVACETEKCAREASAEDMMQAVYREEDIEFLLSARGGD